MGAILELEAAVVVVVLALVGAVEAVEP